MQQTVRSAKTEIPKSTPAPWEFIECGTANAIVRISDDCTVEGRYNGAQCDLLRHADARLIAAAPLLLEACDAEEAAANATGITAVRRAEMFIHAAELRTAAIKAATTATTPSDAEQHATPGELREENNMSPEATIEVLKADCDAWKQLAGEYMDCLQTLCMTTLYEKCRPVSHKWPGRKHVDTIREGVAFLLKQNETLATELAAARELPFVVAYFDHGPSGPCGQTMDTTCPWTLLYAFESEDQYQQWIRLSENNRFGRDGARAQYRAVYKSEEGSIGSRWIDMRDKARAALAAKGTES